MPVQAQLFDGNAAMRCSQGGDAGDQGSKG